MMSRPSNVKVIPRLSLPSSYTFPNRHHPKKHAPQEETAKILAALQRAKEQAVIEEKYTLAKVVRGLIQIASRATEEIHNINAEKAKAVEADDFDQANALKVCPI